MKPDEPTPLERQVTAAISQQWDAFAARHPRLADVLDEPRLTARIAERLSDDPAYVRAMEQAATTEAAARLAARIVRTTVSHWLRDLVRRV